MSLPNKKIAIIMLGLFFLILSLSKIIGSSTDVDSNVSEEITQKEVPAEEASFEMLEKYRDIRQEYQKEYKIRRIKAFNYIDSIYAEGNVREFSQLFKEYHRVLKSNGSATPASDDSPSIDAIERRIEKLLPSKGCIADSMQYANFFSTIYEVSKYSTITPIQKKYLGYLNRNCKFKHYDTNVLFTEERFVAQAKEQKIISASKANALSNEIFKHVSTDDFFLLKELNNGKSFKGYGTVEKKKNRTISYIEAPSTEFNAATALAASVVNLFTYNVYSSFKMHPSIENIELGFYVSELEYNWYAGYYHAIYAVTIKTNKNKLDSYYEDNSMSPPASLQSDLAMSQEDKEFFSRPISYDMVKKWCRDNGFACSKYIVERTR